MWLFMWDSRFWGGCCFCGKDCEVGKFFEMGE